MTVPFVPPTRGDGPVRFAPDIPNTPGTSETVPSSWYTDPERFELERKYVLNPSWQIMCRSEELTEAGDHVVWEGHGETIVITRRKDGGLDGFHNVCLHRGARIVRDSGKCARRFKCPWHDWVYDYAGNVVGVPDRDDFDQDILNNLKAPQVELAEWGGWVWGVLAGPGVAPPLKEWLGEDILVDLGAYRMEDMYLREKITWYVDVNWKVVIDAFNEFYHAPALHHIPPQDVKDGREMRIFEFDRHSMMVVPLKGALPKLQENPDHQSVAICHYTIFPTGRVQQQPRAPAAVPLGPGRAQQDPVRDVGAVVQDRRPGLPRAHAAALGPPEDRRGRGRLDLGGRRRDITLVVLQGELLQRPRVQDPVLPQPGQPDHRGGCRT